MHSDRDASNRHQQSASLLPPQAQGLPGDRSRRYSESDDGSSSVGDSWTDTGDIAEQLDGEEDPLRQRLFNNDTALDDEILAGVFKRQHAHKHSKRVRYQEPRSSSGERRSSSRHAGAVNKEAIHIPDAAPHRASKAERLIAGIMAGGSSSIHGLTGKSLIYFTSIFVSLGVFLFGYDQGVMSGIITYVPYLPRIYSEPLD